MRIIKRIRLVKSMNRAASVFSTAIAFLATPFIAAAFSIDSPAAIPLVILCLGNLALAAKMRANARQMADLDRLCGEELQKNPNLTEEELSSAVLQRMREEFARGKMKG